MPVIVQTEVEQETSLVFEKVKEIDPLRIRGTDGRDVILMTWPDYLERFGALFEAASMTKHQQMVGRRNVFALLPGIDCLRGRKSQKLLQITDREPKLLPQMKNILSGCHRINDREQNFVFHVFRLLCYIPVRPQVPRKTGTGSQCACPQKYGSL